MWIQSVSSLLREVRQSSKSRYERKDPGTMLIVTGRKVQFRRKFFYGFTKEVVNYQQSSLSNTHNPPHPPRPSSLVQILQMSLFSESFFLLSLWLDLNGRGFLRIG